MERLLFPVKPKTPYPVTSDGSLPEVYKDVLDPVETLTFAAACTEKIRLGTSVLDLPFYHPLTLARRLTTLDQLSGGRLLVGAALGWSEDEYEASNADFEARGGVTDEFLTLLKKIWTQNPIEHSGRFFSLPPSDPNRCRSRILLFI